MRLRARTRGQLASLLMMLSAVPGVLVEAQSSSQRHFTWSSSLTVEEGQEIRVPVAVAAASPDELMVADAQGRPRLLRFRKLGASWQLDRSVPLLAAPLDLVFNGSSWIASLRDGVGLMAYQGEELAARKLPAPSDLLPGRIAATPQGRLLVHDLAGRRVIELNDSGQVVREVVIEGHVTALAADWSGGFLVALADESRVVRFDSSWREDGSWKLPGEDAKPAWPVSLAVQPRGNVLVLDRHGGRILVLDPVGRWLGLGGRRGWEPGLLLLPADLVWLGDEFVVVADQGNGRVQLFRRVMGGGTD